MNAADVEGDEIQTAKRKAIDAAKNLPFDKQAMRDKLRRPGGYRSMTAEDLYTIRLHAKPGDLKVGAMRELRRRGMEPHPPMNQRKPKGKYYPGEGRGEVPVEQWDGNRDKAHAALMAAGSTMDSESESGSRYYTMPDGRKVRVADHEPNDATMEWMDRNDVASLSVNRRGFADALSNFLKNDLETER